MSAATLERDLEKYRPVPTVLMEPPRSFDVELSEENDLSEQKSLSTGYFHTFSHHRSIEAGSFLGELFVATSQVAELVREAALQTSSGVVRLADTRLTVARWDLGDHTKGLNEILPRTLIAEMRLLTGFSNERLARLLGVDRRTLTNWANGGGVQAGKADRIRKLARFVRFIDRGFAEHNELALLAQDAAGRTAYELLKEERFDEAAQAVGKGDGWAKRRDFMSELEPARVTSAQAMGLFPAAQPYTGDAVEKKDGEHQQGPGRRGRRVVVQRK